MATRRPRRRRVSELPPRPYAKRRLLLDTHVWIWWQGDDRRLGTQARSAIAAATDVHFSVASAWEIAIKQAVGKLTLPAHADIRSALLLHGFHELPVTLDHVLILRTLPALHRDPFDRMLVAQARAEELTLVTADEAIARYGIEVLLATE